MAEASSSVLAQAWSRVPSPGEVTAGTGTFTRARIERIISLVAALGSLAIGVQSLVEAFASQAMWPVWRDALMLLAFVPLTLMIVACLVGRGIRFGSGAFAIAFVIVLALWPAATAGIPADIADQPWVWYLVNIATLAAVLAFPVPLQIVWTVLVPLLYGVVRVGQIGIGGDHGIVVALDVSFALLLGGVILTLGWLFRSVAAGVDTVRASAVRSYADAAAADALEQERIAVAALMHDSVLGALIAVERASSPREQALAASMAREALTRLANTENDEPEGSDEPMPLTRIADDIERAAADLGVRLPVHRRLDPSACQLPGRVGRALALAATQAVANAVEHANAVGLVVTMDGHVDTVTITVRDGGGGFVLSEVPDDRLGIRGSILARVAAVGGDVRIDTGDHGTTVTLIWRKDAV